MDCSASFWITVHMLLYNIQVSFVTSLLDFDSVIIIPRVAPHVTNLANLQKRSSDSVLKIMLPIPNEDIVLSLTPSDSLFAPEATREEQNEDVFTSTSLDTDCFFQGSIVGYGHSYAAISDCRGLVGLFHINSSSFSIAPLPADPDDLRNQSYEKSIERPHVIKRLNTTAFHNTMVLETDLKDLARKKRASGSRDRYLEVMMVADHSVLSFHGNEDAEMYLLSLFNMLNMIYQHSSLGVTIKLSLVKLVLLSNETVEEIWLGGDPRNALDRFCVWASFNSQRSDSQPGHFDFSMYLSRDRMAPAGYAPVTGMCRPERSCALIKEDGFSTAFVAAHEIGHVLGITHDGESGNKCVNEPKRGSIMAPLVMANLNNYFWSPCSQEEISTIIDTLYCLDDKPYPIVWKELRYPLGRNWQLDEQCRKDFGDGFELCSRYTHNFKPCEHLWCSTPENRYLCKTKRAPPLDGSSCGEGMWCYKADCITTNINDSIWQQAATATNQRLQIADGGWSDWSSWSKCSTSCSRGFKSRTRLCNNPMPALGGKTCEGDNFDLRICDLANCHQELTDYRAQQCSSYNKKGRTYVPFEHDDESKRCLLNCRTLEQNEPLYGDIEAADGTFCSYEEKSSMCYAGKCILVGCDGKLHSKAVEDVCGQCQGHGTNCTARQQHFNNILEKGVHLLLRVYEGTRNFRMKKPHDSFNIILVNAKTNQTLVQRGRVEESRSFVDSGALWRYQRSRGTESLRVTGPLQAAYDLYIDALATQKATLNIAFTEPLDIERPGDLKQTFETNQAIYGQEVFGPSTIAPISGLPFYWLLTEWSDCSKSCGGGLSVLEYQCVNSKTRDKVTDDMCRGSVKPDPKRTSCNDHNCVVFRWMASEWTPCPVVCEEHGNQTQRRSVFCVEDIGSFANKTMIMNESIACDPLTKPETTRPCRKQNCPVTGYWQTGSWSFCSVTCGWGSQRRSVTCEPVGELLSALSTGEAFCDTSVKPSDTEICVTTPCELRRSTVHQRAGLNPIYSTQSATLVVNYSSSHYSASRTETSQHAEIEITSSPYSQNLNSSSTTETAKISQSSPRWRFYLTRLSTSPTPRLNHSATRHIDTVEPSMTDPTTTQHSVELSVAGGTLESKYIGTRALSKMQVKSSTTVTPLTASAPVSAPAENLPSTSFSFADLNLFTTKELHSYNLQVSSLLSTAESKTLSYVTFDAPSAKAVLVTGTGITNYRAQSESHQVPTEGNVWTERPLKSQASEQNDNETGHLGTDGQLSGKHGGTQNGSFKRTEHPQQDTHSIFGERQSTTNVPHLVEQEFITTPLHVHTQSNLISDESFTEKSRSSYSLITRSVLDLSSFSSKPSSPADSRVFDTTTEISTISKHNTVMASMIYTSSPSVHGISMQGRVITQGESLSGTSLKNEDNELARLASSAPSRDHADSTRMPSSMTGEAGSDPTALYQATSMPLSSRALDVQIENLTAANRNICPGNSCLITESLVQTTNSISSAQRDSKPTSMVSKQDSNKLANSSYKESTAELRTDPKVTVAYQHGTSVQTRVDLSCTQDQSNFCDMMNAAKCKLLLFKRICCKSCNSFNI